MNATPAPDLLSRLTVGLYCWIHGRLKRRGGGWLLRRALPFLPGLRRYPLTIPEVGTATLDFRDVTSYALLNYVLGDPGTDRDLLPALERFFSPGDVLWDIGANAGLISAHFARPRFAARRIEAFDPSPFAIASLQRLFQGHPVARVHPFALSDRPGEMAMHFVPGQSTLSSFVPLPGATQQTVPIRRADDLLQAGALLPPRLVKIDAEGHEPEILRGMAGTISAHRPVIFFENSFPATRSIPAPAGYQKWLVAVGGLGQLVEDLPGTPSHDAVFIPTERLPAAMS